MFFWKSFSQEHSSIIPSPLPQLVLMSLSAHPDDEDGATLAYYAKLNGVKTYSLFFTRGEGGQNEIGSQLYGDLGILRTKETGEAATILGSEIHFLGFPDFGFSKTAKETFSMWGGKDSVVARLVYFIRALTPDVIITNHDTVTTKPNRQHGNHQAVGISAYEACKKAADSSYHPEQLHNGIIPWQVKKIYFRFFARDSASNKYPVISIDVTRKVTSGQSIDEIALAALRKHRSQGVGLWSLDSIPLFTRQHRYYLVKQNKDYLFDNADLFSGIEPSLKKSASINETNEPTSSSTQAISDITKATAKHSANISVGLVKTYDTTVEEILKAFNIKYTLLDSALLAKENLHQFSAIILDLRTYQYRRDAEKHNNLLLEYVRNGGNLVCFYHKQGDWNGKNVAPYPLTLTGERVTEENAPVTLLQPYHPLFTAPNQITPNDWAGWIQERSIYLPSDDTAKTSSAYQRLLAMDDTDEHQPPTSLLWCGYGKGSYTYCSLALYRQLRIVNNGALKLFFNMISQPRH